MKHYATNEPVNWVLNQRTVRLALILGVAGWTRWTSPAADNPSDPLWHKAVALASANEDWVPGLTIVRLDIVRKGKTNATHEIWQESRLGNNGAVVKTTVKVLEDGKEVTKPEKSKEENDKHSLRSPFNAQAQDQLTVQPTHRTRSILGKSCVGYEFVTRDPNGPSARGRAWLDQETGAPLELENVTLDPLPDKHLKELSITTRYETPFEGVWRARETLIAAKASVFFISVDTLTTISLTNYWRKPKPAL